MTARQLEAVCGAPRTARHNTLTPLQLLLKASIGLSDDASWTAWLSKMLEARGDATVEPGAAGVA